VPARVVVGDGASLEDAELFQRLRDLRKRLADEHGVPAYIVFSDATLRAMAELRPAVDADLLDVPGVGPAKLEDASLAAAVDRVFAAWDDPSSPGCAVGVARDDRSVMERAYGMADLEHDIPNTAETIFEAGSVAKQFTAAAVVLLALDGKLSLEDDVRTYMPELPDYGTTITLRHMLTHTSGLRDWGSVAGIAGWGRGARTHTHDHVLEILSRQSALNFEPGASTRTATPATTCSPSSWTG
jgi:CubicO group peptidase (beta-lactamase class C family)